MSKRKNRTTDSFKQEVFEINPNIEVMGEFNGVNNKVKCKCLVDGHIWEVRASHLLYDNSGCPQCFNNSKSEKLSLTHEEFITRLEQVNKDITVLGKYTGMLNKIKVKCNIDNYEWYANPNNILNNNTGCPKCAGNVKRTHDEFVKLAFQNNKNIVILSNYINKRTKIKCKCLIDNYEFETLPSSIINNKYVCSKCANVLLKSTSEFKEEMKLINKDINIIGEYINNYTKIDCFCKIHNIIFSTKPTHLLENCGCPICNKSKGEKLIASYLNNYNIDYIPQMKYDDLLGLGGGNLSYDFYLSKYNLLIEYQGQFHDGNINGNYQTQEDFERQQEHDMRKKQFAMDSNIKLLEIWYWDFKNIEEILNKELIKSNCGNQLLFLCK